jgi:hypothetical protein
MPEHLTTAVARAALTELVNQINAAVRPSVLIADLRAVRRIDPEAPVAGALICAPVVGKIEHLYIVTDSPVVRSVAAAAAHTIGLPCSCHDEEPDPDASRQVPPGEQP